MGQTFKQGFKHIQKRIQKTQKCVKIGPIKVSQALVKCSRGETYDFKTIFWVPGSWEAKTNQIWRPGPELGARGPVPGGPNKNTSKS